MKLRLGLILVPALALTSNVNADANSLNDYLGPRVISVGEAGRGDAQGIASTTLNPAGLALSRQVVFEGSYGYRGIDSATSINVAACDSTVPIAGCFYYRFFSAALEIGETIFDRNAHEFGGNLARALTDHIMLGANFRYFDYDSELVDEGNTNGFTFDAGAVVRPTNILNLGVVGYNLMPQDTPQYPTALGAGAVIRPTGTLRVALDGLWNLDDEGDNGTGRYGIGTEFFYASRNRQSGYPLRAGGIYDKGLDASYVTAGAGFVSSKVGLDIGVRRQVDGGDELMIQAGLRLFGPTVR